MQQGGMKNGVSTPNSILRKRANKENQLETRSARKLRLRANRRVSFAPDEELETMHLYQKEKDKLMSPQETEDLTAGLSQRMPWNLSGLQPDASAAAVPESPAMEVPPPADAVASPGFSPLSMDLTNNSNNSFEFRRQDSEGLMDMPHGMLEYTRNITGNVPGLSTLVEEDEEGGLESVADGALPTPCSTAGAATSHLAVGEDAMHPNVARVCDESEMVAASPGLSPFVLREMQLDNAMPEGRNLASENALGPDGSDVGSPSDTDGLKGKWGFTPGREDTLDVSHGRNLMGDTTYNHVYGNSTTGELTAAMKDGGLPAGPSTVASNLAILGQTQAHIQAHLAAPASQPAVSMPEEPDVQESPAPMNTWSAPSPQWSRHRPSIGAADMTIGLLEEDNPTDVWRQPFGGSQGGGNAGAGFVAPPGAVSATRSNQGVSRMSGMGGETTNLLRGSTTGLNLGAQMVGPSAQPVNGPTATVHGFTAQLLADGTTAAVGGAAAGLQRLNQEQLQQRLPSSTEPTSSASGLLGGSDLTLDDFAPPPEPPEASLAQCTPCRKPAPPSVQCSQQHHDDPHAAAEQYGLSPLPPRASQLTQPTPLSAHHMMPPLSESKPYLGGGIENGRTPLDRRPAGASFPQPQSVQHSAQKSASALVPASPLMRSGPIFGSQSPAFGRFARPANAALHMGAQQAAAAGYPQNGSQGSMAMVSHMSQSQQQQLVEHPLASFDLPPITFQEFLQVVEVRFLDDMRRRTSFLPPPELHMGGPEAPPETLSEALNAVHASGAHAALSNTLVNELAEVVEAMHMRNAELEGELAHSNPSVFTAVQMSSPAELERIRDQMKLLKRLCRHRTAMAWKQRRIAFEQALSSEYSTRLAALNDEAEYMRACLSSVQELDRQLCQMDADVESQKASLAAAEHDASQRKALHALQRQRLAELRASNQMRRQRQAEAAQKQHSLRADYEAALAGSQQSQKHLMELRGEGVQECTPSKEAEEGAMAERAEATRKLVQQQEKLDIMLGLMGAQLDARKMSSSGSTWSLSLRGQFRISVGMPAGAGESSSQQGGGTHCHMKVEVLPDGFSSNELSRSLLLNFEALLAGSTSFKPSNLPQAMDDAQVRLGRASTLLSQLRSLPLSWPLLSAVSMNEEHTLKLTFIHVESTTKLEVEVPADGLLHMASTKPRIRAQVIYPINGSAERSREVQEVLFEIQPSPLYLQQVCYVTSQMLCGGSDPKPGPALSDVKGGATTPTRGREAVVAAARSPLRLYGNPLFLTPTGVN